MPVYTTPTPGVTGPKKKAGPAADSGGYRAYQTHFIQNMNNPQKHKSPQFARHLSGLHPNGEEALEKAISGIRRMNQLVLQAKDPQELIDMACNRLGRCFGFRYVWIALTDECAQLTHFAAHGLGEKKEALYRDLKSSNFPSCMIHGLEHDKPGLVNVSHAQCRGCSFADLYPGQSYFCSSLGYENNPYGVLVASGPHEHVRYGINLDLYRELVSELGQALHRLRLEHQKRAIHQELSEKTSLKENEEKYRALFENANDAILLLAESGIVECNPAAEELFDRNRDQLIHCHPADLSPPMQPDGRDSREKADAFMKRALRGDSIVFGWQHQRLDGKLLETEISLRQMESEGEKTVLTIIRDISERKQYEAAQRIIYQVANAMVFTDNLEDLVRIVRSQLSKLTDTRNFYIALYEKTTGKLSVPFQSDEKDHIKSWLAKDSLTGLVVEEKRSLLLKTPDMQRLIRAGKIIQIGSMSKAWLGIPLFSGPEIMGVMVLQSYDNPNAFNERSVEVLEFISNQVSLALQRQQDMENLRAAKNKAEESNRLKTAFLNNLSHEIRTPLNAIMGFSEILKESELPREELRQISSTIHRGSLQLLSIIEDLLQVSAIETGSVEIHRQKTDINGLMREVFRQLEPMAREKDLKLKLATQLPPGLSTVTTDATKLMQIITNLVHNAIKFTTVGQVEYGCRKEEDRMQFYVSDTGPGVEPGHQKLIFDRFHQAKVPREEIHSGLGLGLSISKSYVELLGGRIWLDSAPPKGSTFYFSIPCHRLFTKAPD